MSLVGDYVGEKNKSTGMGFFNFAGNVGIVLGPIIGGALLIPLDFINTFIIMGIAEFIGISVLILWMLVKKRRILKIESSSELILSPEESQHNVPYVDSTRQHEN